MATNHNRGNACARLQRASNLQPFKTIIARGSCLKKYRLQLLFGFFTVAFFKNKPWMKMRLQISKQAYKHQSRLLQGGSDQDYFILDRKVFDGNRRVVDNRKFLFCLVVSRAKILKLRVVDNTDIYFVE
jgi:hypothetical protein